MSGGGIRARTDIGDKIIVNQSVAAGIAQVYELYPEHAGIAVIQGLREVAARTTGKIIIRIIRYLPAECQILDDIA